MSCCCCGCCGGVSPRGQLLQGSGRKERLLSGDQQEDQDPEENRRSMDISLLREQYRSSREAQRRHTQVLLLRTVSEEVSEAVSIVPVSQGLTSPWEPNRSPPPAVTFDPDPTTYDPWHVHLGLHRRSHAAVAVQLTAPSPETANTDGSSRRSSSCSEAVSSRQDEDSTTDSPSSSRPPSPSCSSTTEEEALSTGGSRGDPDPGSSERSRGDPDPGSSERSRGDPGPGSSERSRGDPDPGSSERSRGDPDPGSSERSRGDPEKMDPVQVPVSASLDASELNPGDGSRLDHPDRSLTCSDGSSAPLASITCSDGSSAPLASITCPPSTTSGLNEDQSAGRRPRQDALQTSSTWTWTSSAPALRFSRQLSVGGLGSSAGVHLNQNHHPFPSRKPPRISEAARRLGMYSSF